MDDLETKPQEYRCVFCGEVLTREGGLTITLEPHNIVVTNDFLREGLGEIIQIPELYGHAQCAHRRVKAVRRDDALRQAWQLLQNAYQ